VVTCRYARPERPAFARSHIRRSSRLTIGQAPDSQPSQGLDQFAARTSPRRLIAYTVLMMAGCRLFCVPRTQAGAREWRTAQPLPGGLRRVMLPFLVDVTGNSALTSTHRDVVGDANTSSNGSCCPAA